MKRLISRFRKNEDGIVAIEGAIFLVLFITCTMGLFEITDYLSYRQKIARSADDLGQTITLADNLAEVQALMDIPKVNANSHGYVVSVYVCQGATQQAAYTQVYKNPVTKMDGCNWKQGDTPGNLTMMNCGSKGWNVPNEQYAIVQVYCHYNPIVNFMGLFKGIPISSTAYATFRKNFVTN